MKHRLPILLSLLIALTLWQCARRGSPTGGPKDITPPMLLQSVPKSETVEFKGKKIRLHFDEFVVTKDVRKQLIISPPMKTLPIAFRITMRATRYPISNTYFLLVAPSIHCGMKATSPMLSLLNPIIS